jgi:hypothetical protein
VFVVGAVHDASSTPALATLAEANTANRAAARPRSHRRSNISVISLEEDHRVPGVVATPPSAARLSGSS